MKQFLISADILFLSCVYTLICVNALPYKYLDGIKFQNCPQKNRCSLIGNATFRERLCECDRDECSKFGDCCIDAARIDSVKTSSKTCMHYGNYTHQGLYVINTCPDDYSGPEEIISQCTEDDFSDPLVSAPVTDASSGETYLNEYCAICNDVLVSSMKKWKQYFACDNDDDDDLDSDDISWDDIKYDSYLENWGLERDGEIKPCKIIYNKPPAVSIVGRPCRSNLISSCSRTWNKLTYKRECEIYMAVVTDRANKAYMNPHCALCNGVKESELMCLLTGIVDRVNNGYEVYLDFIEGDDGDKVGVSIYRNPSCPGRQVYDPVAKICRRTGCAVKGYKIQNDKCVKV